MPIDAPHALVSPPGPAVVPLALASINPPESTTTSPETSSTMGWPPCSSRTWSFEMVRPASRTTITAAPPPDWATPVVKSSVPRLQLVLVMVPALESIVVVPAASQFHAGEVLKFSAQVLEVTLTDGGSAIDTHTQLPPAHPDVPPVHACPHVPQLFGSDVVFVSQPSVSGAVPALQSARPGLHA